MFSCFNALSETNVINDNFGNILQFRICLLSEFESVVKANLSEVLGLRCLAGGIDLSSHSSYIDINLSTLAEHTPDPVWAK